MTDIATQLDRIENTLSKVQTDQCDMNKLLRGDEKESEPQGLVHRVSQNTHFRQIWQKLLWIIVVALAGMTSSIILLLITKI